MGLKNILSIKNLSFEYFRRDENEQVTEIIEAINAGDGEKAKRLMSTHIRNAKNHMIERFVENG